MRDLMTNSREKAKQKKKQFHLIGIGFVLGFIVSSVAILNIQVLLHRLRQQHHGSSNETGLLHIDDESNTDSPVAIQATSFSDSSPDGSKVSPQLQSSRALSSSLNNVRILVAIAAFDFNQIPHLESILDSYHDICVAGAKVDVVVHATVAYPVTFIDLLNSRFTCQDFAIQIVLKPPSVRLHLVDCHRQLFYERIHDYDLFVYTEEDIQVTPRTVATYLEETHRVQQLLEGSTQYHPSDFNVGIVRYEYNYPSNVVIDDKTRHAVQNVTRVYWEHSSYKGSLIPNGIDQVAQDSKLQERYVGMKNHHQGMFLATQDLLLAWKDRRHCNFDVVKNRPGVGGQPAEGTQRVWMSSQQLFGKRHCNVQQVLPKDKFGALTVLHVPNKNYRRVGKYRKRVFSDGTEEFDQTPDLLTALQLHLAIRKEWPTKPQHPYRGTITMIDEVTQKRTQLLERRMKEYRDYVNRGGTLSDYDFTRTLLVEEE
ncbi:expressed unknown protein [Seminavis robusta]|uniref:Uncharacterized protein n=1 Tax=Seminavis robusta TaxID=568900 RepID=A0A9N8DJE6_9STRA|nr:expressed unknown protein [Seminavis robusta]|eukprot:Sro174_g076780.1 n/a (482) ;mRNA; f:76211-77848